jgi:hypothetical protein
MRAPGFTPEPGLPFGYRTLYTLLLPCYYQIVSMAEYFIQIVALYSFIFTVFST